MIEPFLLYSLVFGVSLVCLVMAMITFSYRKILKKFYDIWKDEEGVKKARETANEIMREANLSASKVLSDANIFANGEKSTLNLALEKVTEKEIEDLEAMLMDLKSKSSQALLSEISKISQGLSNEMRQSFLNTQTEMEGYKKIMIDRLDKSIYKIVSEVSQNVISKRLQIEDHDEILLSELEEAKKRNAI